MLALPVDALVTPIFKMRHRREATATCSYTLHIIDEFLLNCSRTGDANCLLIIFKEKSHLFGVEGGGERWQLEVNPS